FLEQMPHGPLPTAVQAAALLATAILAGALWRGLRGADRRVVSRPLVAIAAILAMAGLSRGVLPLLAKRQVTSAGGIGTAQRGVRTWTRIVVDPPRRAPLGAGGSAAARTPNIDAPARAGVRFATTFPQASWTRPSIATILTGMYPSSHGATHKAD